MNNDELPNVAVIFNGDTIQEIPSVTSWDWIKYYVWNFWRKPAVKKKQKQLIQISKDIQEALKKEVYPNLILKIGKCEMCRDAYGTLKPQIFLSQIEAILRRMKCTSHHKIYEDFIKKYEGKFRESDSLARWINGFQ